MQKSFQFMSAFYRMMAPVSLTPDIQCRSFDTFVIKLIFIPELNASSDLNWIYENSLHTLNNSS